jgi:hypothetical protein
VRSSVEFVAGLRRGDAADSRPTRATGADRRSSARSSPTRSSSTRSPSRR